VLFNLSVYIKPEVAADGTTTSAPVERIQNVSIFEGAGERRIDRVLGRFSNLVTSVGAFIADVDAAQGDTVPIPKADLGKPVQFEGGLDSGPLTRAVYAGSERDKTGFHGLDDVDLFNILCVPPDARGESTPLEAYGDALAYCVDRRAMLIVDPPAAWANRIQLLNDPTARLGADVNLTGPAARNAFLYYPRVRMPTRSWATPRRRSRRAESSPGSSRGPTPGAGSGPRPPASTPRSAR